MISENIQKLLNEQIVKEFYSAYLYLSIEAYLTDKNLVGFAHWFRVQAQEERDHAMMFFDYVNKVGGRVKLGQIEAPNVDFDSIEEALKLSLDHERFVTKSIYNIVDAAVVEHDHKTNQFLQWFVNEQTEEESNSENNLKKFQLVGNDGRGILMMDTEMAARVYTPPVVAV